MSSVLYQTIPNFPNYYVSDDGSIWSKTSRWGLRKIPKLLKPCRTKEGYLRVCLVQNGRGYMRQVHRLVLEAFVGPCPEGMQCRHLDGNPSNNHLSNLCWGTPKDNMRDMATHNTVPRGEDRYLSKLTEDDVRSIRAYTERSHGWKTKLAKQYGVKQKCIWQVVNRKTWKHID